MGRRKKKKSRKDPLEHEEDPNAAKVPKTFVTKQGRVGRAVRQLMLDTRRIFEPNTATRLRISPKNQMRDFLSVAGPLGVTHLLSFTATDLAANFRIARLPRGPTLTFRIESYSLLGDVLKAQKRPETPSREFLTAPLAILNGFNASTARHVSLMAVVFQSIFPMLNVQTVKLADAKRVVFFNYIAEADVVELRHYIVRTKPLGLSRTVRSLTKSHVPDLHDLRDISEFVLAEDSVSEPEDDAAVELPSDSAGPAAGAGARARGKEAIKLKEIGPRMRLALLKIEEGCHEGKVLHHRFIQLSEEEMAARERAAESRAALRAQRKAEQKRNVARKRGTDGEGEADGGDDGGGAQDRAEASDSMEEEDYYREAVGEEPDPELFTKGTAAKARGFVPKRWAKRKRDGSGAASGAASGGSANGAARKRQRSE